MLRNFGICFLALVGLLPVSSALAAPARAVVVVQGAEPAERISLEDAAADWLVARNPPLVPVVDPELACEDDPCLLAGAKTRRASAVLQIIVAAVSSQRLLVVRFVAEGKAPREGSARLQATAEADLGEQLTVLLAQTLGQLRSSAAAPPPGRAPDGGSDDGGGAWYTQWWVWGVVAVMVGAAVVVGVQATQDGGRNEAVLEISGPSPVSLLPPVAEQ